MSHRPLQEQRQGCGHVGRTRDGGREGIDDLEEVARCRLVKRLRTASDVNGTHRFLGEIECFNSLVNNGIAGHAAPIGHVGKREEWLQVALHTAILHLTPIVVGILRRHNIVVDHYPLVVFLHIDITQLAHLAQLRLAPSLLDAEMLVELCLRNAELVHLSLSRHAQPAIAGSTCQQARPEIGEGLDDARIVLNGCPIITRSIKQQSTVVECLQVVGLIAQDEIEIFNGPIVVAQLLAQQTSVVVGKEVIGIHIDGLIVVFHSLAQTVGVDPHHCPIHVVVDYARLVVNGFREGRIGQLPVVALHVQSGQNRPGIAIIGIMLQRFLKPPRGRCRVVFVQIDFRLQRISHVHIGPTADDVVEVGMCTFVLLEEMAAVGPVEPIAPLVGT